MLVVQKDSNASMHSSRMRAARLLLVSPSMHCGRGGVCLWSRGGVFQHAIGQTHTPRQTDTCKNITFANYVEKKVHSNS